MIKLIAADMDGTLLSRNHTISKENVAAIKSAESKGIRFAIATGRAYADVRPIIDEYDLNCECVALNGGEYYDNDGNILEGIYIDKEKKTRAEEAEGKISVELFLYLIYNRSIKNTSVRNYTYQKKQGGWREKYRKKACLGKRGFCSDHVYINGYCTG